MIALVILVLTAIGTGIAALSILGHPGWLWQILASVSVLNVVAALVVVLRRSWGHRVALILLGAQVTGAVIGLIVVVVVELRDLPYLDAITLVVFIFAPVVLGIIVLSLIAVSSIDRLRWPDA